MFVSKINIQEFKGIKSCSQPLELSDFTVLIGRNNSGKSSILEALSLLPIITDRRLRYADRSKKDLLSEIHGGRSSLIYAYSGTASIEYTVARATKAHRTWKISLTERGEFSLDIEGMTSDSTRINPEKSVAKALRVPVGDKDMVGNLNKMVFFIPNDTSFLNNLLSTASHENNRYFVMKTGAHTRVAKEIINQCVDDKYSEIFFAPELSGRKELPDGNALYVKIKDLGDGIEKVALLVLWLEALSPSLILWDDFEGSAHPTLIRLLLNWLSKKKWQVILSTHSIDVLNILLDVKPKNAKVMQLKKTAEDVLIHQNLSLEELEDLLEANQDPRKVVGLLEL